MLQVQHSTFKISITLLKSCIQQNYRDVPLTLKLYHLWLQKMKFYSVIIKTHLADHLIRAKNSIKLLENEIFQY